MAPRTKKTEETKEESAVEIKKPVRKTAVKKTSEKKAADNKSETVPEVKKRGRKPKTETAATVPEKAVAAVPAEAQEKTETESVKAAPVRRITKRVLKTKRLIEKEKSAAEEKLAETASSSDAATDVNTEDAAKAVNTERHGKFYNGRYQNAGSHDPKNPDISVPTMDQLYETDSVKLIQMAADAGLTDIATHSKQDVVEQLMAHYIEQQGQGYKLCSGVLDILGEGYGFLRQDSLLPSADDIYVAQSQIKRFGLRTGDYVVGVSRPGKDKEKYYSMVRVERINDISPEKSRQRKVFTQLTPIFPDRRITMETTSDVIATRIIDLFCPIGCGQRGLIVAPPKAGKTMLMKAIANAVEENYKDIHVIVCLIGERPEEVTDMRRSVRGEVIAATFDEAEENQTRVAELAIEKAKRMVEAGKDVFLLLDGITRLTRAYNLALPSSGRTLSGGIDPVALHPGKRFFGAARNIEEGGSLTIIATCLVDTGSRMDDLIYEEFKGTGNMEIHLDRKLAERGCYPAVDITKSSTRRDEFLYEKNEFTLTRLLRRMVGAIATDSPNATTQEASQRVIDSLKRTSNNAAFLESIMKDRYKAV